MANGVFNIARGKLGYYYYAVENSLVVTATGTPAFTSTANSAFIILLVETSGLQVDATLVDHDDLLALLAATNNEPTGGTYARKTLTDADLAAVPAPDDTNERYDLDIPDQTWTALTTTGNAAISKLLVCFDPDTTAGTDSTVIPLTHHDFVLTPDGSDVTAQIATAGFWRSA
jgi:hypothetical protein